MASHNEKDDAPMLPNSDSSSSSSSSSRLANTSSTTDGFGSSTVVLGYTGPLQTQRSGKLGMCNVPYCTTCPSHYNRKAAENPTSRDTVDSMSPNGLYDHAKRWVMRFATSVDRYLPKIMNPHKTCGQIWSIFFAVSCLFAIFVDPLFFFIINVNKSDKCLWINWPMGRLFVAVRTITDVLFGVNIFLQFRMAYEAREFSVNGGGQLVKHPIKIALHYFRGKLLLDLFIVLPLPQILILWILPPQLGAENNAKNLLRTAVLIQYIPKLYRLLPLLAGQTPTGFIFESAWANFLINISTFILAGHFIGSCWYLMGLRRVNQCLRDACGGNYDRACRELINCGHGTNKTALSAWKDNARASACFQEDGFHYGIYWKAVNLTHDPSLYTRYIYSLFWGFQQISTLAGNQVPSYYHWEVLFTMGIVGLGLLLFAFLIGNMQNFIQGLCQRNWETTLRRRDMDQWMRHKGLPKSIRKRVKTAERSNWADTRGFNEKLIFDNMPEDLQRDIRRHLFEIIKNVSIFSGMDEPVLDAIHERLKPKKYTKKSTVLHRGGLVDKMVFIVSGKMESIGEDGSVISLSEGDFCGEELLTWGLDRSSTNSDETRIRLPSKGLFSQRTVRCVKKVEAFSLSVEDLEEVMRLFPGFPRSDSSGLDVPK